MTGKLNWPRKRPVVLAGIAILAVAAAATGAWVTQPPESAPPRLAKSAKSKRVIVEAPSHPAAASAAIVLQDPPAPPEPTSTDFARGGAPPAASTPAIAASAAEPPQPTNWSAMPIDELRAKANANEIPAMEELARRLVQGVGVTKDQQAGAGWLLRAAQRGSTQSAFNVAVMYERGFVVERDSTKAIEWYRKAVAANMPMAKHNLALLLRDGKGAPRDGKEAVELLRSAARQGMAASMFTLGDIHERGDAAPMDAPTALAWFAITAEFERQTNRGTETALAKTATQRTQTLQRILTPAELERAQQSGQAEFKLIVEALSPPKPAPAGETVTAMSPPPADVDPPGWPKAANDQVRVIQQVLVDLRFLRDKPDGTIGPMTRAAIRAFQRSIAVRETGEPTRDVYAALQNSIASRDIVANSALPPPPVKTEPVPSVTPKPEIKAKPPRAETRKAEVAQTESPPVTPPKVETAEPTPAPASATAIDPGTSEPLLAPPSSADFARAMPKPEAAEPDTKAWPAALVDQVKAIQVLLRDLKFLHDAPDGDNGPLTRAAIRAFQRSATLRETGEPTKEVYAALGIALASRDAAANSPPATPPKAEAAEPDTKAWPAALVDQVKAIQVLLRDLKFLHDAPDGDNGPLTRAAIRAFQRSATLRETGEPTKEVYAALGIALASRDAAANSPPATPPKAEAAEPDTKAWPAALVDQVKAIQVLLRDLKFSRDTPDGLNGPGTRASIRDYERAAGLAVTGEPSKALFESLKELRLLMAPKPN